MQPTTMNPTLPATAASLAPTPPRPIAPTPDSQASAATATSQGRCYQTVHPVQTCNYTSLALNSAATIGGIAGGIFTPGLSPYLSYGLYGIGALAAVNLVSGGCDSFYLKAWRPKKTLEQTVDTTIAEVATLKGKIQELGNTIGKLTSERAGLAIDLERERAENQALTSKIQTMNENLDKLSRDCARLQQSLNETLKLKEQWQSLAQKVALGTASFDAQFSDLLPHAHDAEAAIGTLQQLAISADNDLARAQVLAGRMEQARSGWIAVLHDLYQKFGTIKADLDSKARQLEEQRSLTTDLERTNSKLEGNAAALQPMIAKFESIAQQYTQTQARFAEAQSKLNCLRTLPDDASIPYIRNAAQEALRALQPPR